MGIDFRHRASRDVHSPSFYLHLQPGEIFAAAGVWHPDSQTLQKIRAAIVEKPERWKRAAHGKEFASSYTLSGDALKRVPLGFSPDHPLVEDLKWKDHVGSAMLDERTVTSEDFLPAFAKLCRQASPYVGFLCEALGLPF